MRELALLLKELLKRPIQPGPMYVFATGENMADQITYRVLLPAVVDVDVVNRKLDAASDGMALPTIEVDVLVPSIEMSFDQGARVRLELTDFDDATPPNASTPSVFNFVALDTVPPQTPGELGVEVVGETPESPVPPTPVTPPEP